jgi:hypothetical protein
MSKYAPLLEKKTGRAGGEKRALNFRLFWWIRIPGHRSETIPADRAEAEVILWTP